MGDPTARGREHRYEVTVRWSGDTGAGYRGYSRDHVIDGAGKPAIAGSSDPHFRGDAARWSPEELLVASLSACHKLWYLHLCADRRIAVLNYVDHAEGVMVESADGGGEFTRVTLRPRVTLREGSDARLATDLHHQAHALCFIARSVRFPVEVEPVVALAHAG